MNEHFGFRVGPNYLARLQEERARQAEWKHIDKPEWLRTQGDYSFPFTQGTAMEQRRNMHELIGFERYVAQTLWTRLHTKKGASVKFADIGAMDGITLTRLAYAFRGEIEEKRLQLFSFNIENKPSSGFYNAEILTSEEVEFITSMNDLIEDVRLTPREYRKSGLCGQIDVLHEFLSVNSNSHAPEYDVFRTAQLLSSDGHYYIFKTRGLTQKNSPYLPEELKCAHTNLRDKLGLSETDTVETGVKKGFKLNYVVFKGQNASPVDYD